MRVATGPACGSIEDTGLVLSVKVTAIAVRAARIVYGSNQFGSNRFDARSEGSAHKYSLGWLDRE